MPTTRLGLYGGARSPYGSFAGKTQEGASTYTLTAESGSYSYTGTDAALVYDRVLSAEGGTYTYTGTDASLIKGYVIGADAGSYTYTGTDAGFIYNRVLSLDSGSFSLTGADVTLTYSGGVLAGSAIIMTPTLTSRKMTPRL